MPGLDASVKLLLHCNGANEGNSFPDASDSIHTVTANGDAETSTDESKFGGASYLSEVAGDFLSIPDSDDWDFGSGDFTIDFWIRPTNLDNWQTIMVQATADNAADMTFEIDYDPSFGIRLFLTSDYLDPWNDDEFIGFPQLTLNTWTHIAFVRSGDNFYSFQDGVLIDTGTNYGSNTIPSADAPLYIGGTGNIDYPSVFTGYLDEIRISKGIARWTSTFSPPSAEYDSGGGDENLTENESIFLSEDWSVHASDEALILDENIDLSETWNITTNPELIDLDNSIKITDIWNITFPNSNIVINLDLRWLTSLKNVIQTSLSWLIGNNINTDLRWLSENKNSISTDLRWLTNPYTILSSITHGDMQIFINSVDILAANDIDVESGNIVHTVSQKSIASFVLARKHDDLDRTHLGVASQITNQNPIQIYIQGHLEFDGFISSLNVNSDTETIAVTALMEQPLDNRHSIELPLPSVNEKLHIYHCLVNAVQIDNPKESVSTVIIGNNGRYWSGSSWVFYVTDALIFSSDIAAENYITSYNDLTATQIFRSKSPSVTYVEKNPQYYKGVKVDLGLKIQQQIDKYRDLEYIFDGKGMIASQIEDGTYITKPNYSYFWAVLAKNALTGIENGDYRYIGTSLASTTTDLWILNGVVPMYQKIKENIETELGFYYIGEAPYKEISTKNGQLIPVEKWQDRHDGLYNVIEAHYNYIAYSTRVADLEYQKLLNLHGDILPVTSSSIEITFDAYYYYTVKLLTRINVTNTTVANTFNNTNGFPVSVKSISINFKTMKVTLTTDNRLSQIELDEIDAQMPDEDNYKVLESAVRVYRKFDLKTWQFVT